MTVMPSIASPRTIAASAAMAMALCTSPAGAVDLVNPAPLVDAFKATCLSGFPNVDAIANHAIAAGWVERKVRLIGSPAKSMSATNLPRFFEWRGLTMTVTRAGEGTPTTTCQVSTPSAPTLDTTALASAAASALGLGAPVRTTKRGSDLAQWRPTPGQVVQASADKYNGLRSANLLIRIEPEPNRQ